MSFFNSDYRSDPAFAEIDLSLYINSDSIPCTAAAPSNVWSGPPRSSPTVMSLNCNFMTLDPTAMEPSHEYASQSALHSGSMFKSEPMFSGEPVPTEPFVSYTHADVSHATPKYALSSLTSWDSNICPSHCLQSAPVVDVAPRFASTSPHSSVSSNGSDDERDEDTRTAPTRKMRRTSAKSARATVPKRPNSRKIKRSCESAEAEELKFLLAQAAKDEADEATNKDFLASMTEEERLIRRRTKNRQAARLSRLRKRLKLQVLEEALAEEKAASAEIVDELEAMRSAYSELKKQNQHLNDVLRQTLSMSNVVTAAVGAPIDAVSSPLALVFHPQGTLTVEPVLA